MKVHNYSAEWLYDHDIRDFGDGAPAFAVPPQPTTRDCGNGCGMLVFTLPYDKTLFAFDAAPSAAPECPVYANRDHTVVFNWHRCPRTRKASLRSKLAASVVSPRGATLTRFEAERMLELLDAAPVAQPTCRRVHPPWLKVVNGGRF